MKHNSLSQRSTDALVFAVSVLRLVFLFFVFNDTTIFNWHTLPYNNRQIILNTYYHNNTIITYTMLCNLEMLTRYNTLNTTKPLLKRIYK